MKALEGWTIVRYQREKDWDVTSTSGIIAPSARNQRMMVKGKQHTISGDPDHNLPDLMRIGEVVASSKFVEGVHLLFNKHDGYGFELDGEYLFALPNDKAMAALD